ncbi:MAG: cyclic nucleotide-binding domain-containing protein [Oligoflexia bacterium]|nr:cyclic nucleotide-binding domain-containing protein [Oligoflexia bacterium]
MDHNADLITLNRGAAIFKAGEAATQVYILRSGLVSLCITRGDKMIELMKVSPGQMLGAEVLHDHSAMTWDYDAIASNDVELVPIDVKAARSWIECSPPLLKLFISALVAKNFEVARETLSLHVRQKDPMPCSPSRVTRLFAVLYHAAAYTGAEKNGAKVVVWSAFRKYCQRSFLESPVRLEQAVFILARLGIARLEMIPCETDPDGPEELGFVHFLDLEKVRRFYELNQKICSGKGSETINEAADPLYVAIAAEIEKWNVAGKVEMPSHASADKSRKAG